MGSFHTSDAALLQRIARGDDRAFSVFYRRHLDGVVAFFRRRVPAPEVAFDLSAETFAAVVVGAGAYAADGPAVAWLYGIARNKLRESLRRGQVEDAARRRLALEPLTLDDLALEAIESRATAGDGALAAALAGLSETIRAPLLSRVVDEASYAEIAATLGCSEQVIRQRVHRGLRALRAELQEGP